MLLGNEPGAAGAEGAVVGGDVTTAGGAVVGGDVTAAGGAVVGGDVTAAGGAVVGGDVTAAGEAVVGGDVTTAGGAVVGGDVTAAGEAAVREVKRKRKTRRVRFQFAMETTMSQTHKRNAMVMDGISMNTCLQRMIKVVSLLHYSPPQKRVSAP